MWRQVCDKIDRDLRLLMIGFNLVLTAGAFAMQ